jgi:2-polyprenyl-3-methyl-5-hydroxy-6-metoxy-1,4-benzoquinol methylase/tetratricopeptide (TPR) repeat protein
MRGPMNRKNEVNTLLSKARAEAQQGNYAGSFFNLGSALALSDQIDEAAEAYRKAVRIAPHMAAGHCGLADALFRLGKFEEAEVEYRQALVLQPNLNPALYNLSRLMFEKGDALQALQLSVRLLASDESAEARSLFVDCSRAGRLPKPITGLTQTLVRAIKGRWLRPYEVMGLASRALELDPIIGKCIERAGATPHVLVPDANLFSREEIAGLVNNQLLILVLESTPVANRAIERFLTSARVTMLERLTRPDPIAADLLAFYKSLAIQCFITEYVFSVTERELAAAQAARERLVAAFASGAEVAPILLVAVAAYFPLATLPGSEKMLTRKWPAAIASLLDQQVREPLKERELESSIPQLTPIGDHISRLVQKQYDESPYPRWIKTIETGGWHKQIDEYLRAMFPLAPFSRLGKNKLDILIAGAGTGRQAIEVARQFSRSRVLAVDLSRRALAYAKRKSDELGVSNIEYGQANILEIDALKRRFDVIYAAGVLHHLADPFAGWRRLVDILAPRGVMNVGLYSERAREDVVAARRFLAEKRYEPTSNDIRRCRNEFERLPTESPLRRVMSFADFYSLSELRDLLFHVQEHSTNLLHIARFLIDNKLQFLGFNQATQTLRRYHQLFPQDGAMIDLAFWDRFEVKNPWTFVAMYQFWVQKAGENCGAAGAVGKS